MAREKNPGLPTRRRTVLGAALRVFAGAALIDLQPPLAAAAALAEAPRARPLTRREAELVDAVADRIWPGARESGAGIYISRSLAGAYAADLRSYRVAAYRLDAAAQRRHRARFAAIAGDWQDELLLALEAGTLRELPGMRGRNIFAMLRRHVIESVLSDPIYGGNRDFAGWKAVGYPGPRRAYSAAEQMSVAPLQLPYQSVADLR